MSGELGSFPTLGTRYDFCHESCVFQFANWATDFHDQLAQSKSKSNWASGRLAVSCTVLDRSQWYFTHVTTVTLSWRVQNIVVISRVYFTLECFEFSSNFEFDRNMLSGTGARRAHLWNLACCAMMIKIIFKCILVNENVWIIIKISLKFVPKGPINNIPALVQMINGFALVRRHAVIWTSGGIDYWHIYASLGLNELKLGC